MADQDLRTYKLIELVGTSPTSYAEATKNAVERAINDGFTGRAPDLGALELGGQIGIAQAVSLDDNARRHLGAESRDNDHVLRAQPANFLLLDPPAQIDSPAHHAGIRRPGRRAGTRVGGGRRHRRAW